MMHESSLHHLRDHLHHAPCVQETKVPERWSQKGVDRVTSLVGRREFPHTSEPPARLCAPAQRPAPYDVKNSTLLCRERLDSALEPQRPSGACRASAGARPTGGALVPNSMEPVTWCSLQSSLNELGQRTQSGISAPRRRSDSMQRDQAGSNPPRDPQIGARSASSHALVRNRDMCPLLNSA